jgi:hypothetical protein
MRNKRLLIPFLLFLSSMIIPFVQATTITACTFDKDTYNQGETGHITVTIYNDDDGKIRITELSATINYYYTDENAYMQKFSTNATLPSEIQQGNSSTFYIPFSLPTNIASGYTNVDVKAIIELWNLQEEMVARIARAHQPLLYIESPYKEQLEEQVTINEQQVTINEQLDGQLKEQLATNKNVTNMMYLFGVTTIVFAAVTVFLFTVNRRMRFLTQPIA